MACRPARLSTAASVLPRRREDATTALLPTMGSHSRGALAEREGACACTRALPRPRGIFCCFMIRRDAVFTHMSIHPFPTKCTSAGIGAEAQSENDGDWQRGKGRGTVLREVERPAARRHTLLTRPLRYARTVRCCCCVLSVIVNSLRDRKHSVCCITAENREGENGAIAWKKAHTPT